MSGNNCRLPYTNEWYPSHPSTLTALLRVVWSTGSVAARAVVRVTVGQIRGAAAGPGAPRPPPPLRAPLALCTRVTAVAPTLPPLGDIGGVAKRPQEHRHIVLLVSGDIVNGNQALEANSSIK